MQQAFANSKLNCLIRQHALNPHSGMDELVASKAISSYGRNFARLLPNHTNDWTDDSDIVVESGSLEENW